MALSSIPSSVSQRSASFRSTQKYLLFDILYQIIIVGLLRVQYTTNLPSNKTGLWCIICLFSALLTPEMPDTSGLSGLTGEQPGLLPSSSSFPTPAPSINVERCQSMRKMIFKSVTQVAQFNGLNSHESPVAQYFNSTDNGISDVQVRCVAQCSQLTFNEGSVRCG